MEVKMETWKKHPTIHDLEVSTNGKIRRPSGKKIAVCKENRNGYMRASVKIGNEYTWRRIHQLVMETYKPKPRPDLIIDHIDEDKTNNSLDNLQWVTNKENLLKAAKKQSKYVFLHNLFDSLSDKHLHATFSPIALQEASLQHLIDKHVYALGGMSLDNIRIAKDLGFGGVVICGDLWNRFDIHHGTDYKELIQHFAKLRSAAG